MRPLALLGLLALVGCSLFEGLGIDRQPIIDRLLAAGDITPEEAAALAGSWVGDLAWTAVAAGAAYFGVQLRRGPPTRAENVKKKRAARHRR